MASTIEQRPLIDPLIGRKEAARLLGIAEQTLAVWITTHRYDLPWIKVGRAVRYRLSDILAFIERRTVTPGASSTPSARK